MSWLCLAWFLVTPVLYPPLLRAEAQVQSLCPVTGRSIAFVATPDGNIKNLIQESYVLSLLIPSEQRNRGRAGFCERSLFFWDEQAASSFLAAHPEAILLSIEEAAYVGRLVAQNRAIGAVSDDCGREVDLCFGFHPLLGSVGLYQSSFS